MRRAMHTGLGPQVQVLCRCSRCYRDYWIINLTGRARRFAHRCLPNHTGFVEPVRLLNGWWVTRRTSGEDGHRRKTWWDVIYPRGTP